MTDLEVQALRNIVGPIEIVDPCPNCGQLVGAHTYEWTEGARYRRCPAPNPIEEQEET